MKESVYLETSVFSFYYDERTDPAIVARRNWTREWWNNYSADYFLFTSTAVFDELNRGNKSHREKAFFLAQTLPALTPTNEVSEIVEVYVKHYVMPRDPVGDALHLALASYYKCEYLLTWNCKNLANANKFSHIKRINAMLGLHIPILVTPLQLTREEL